VERDDDLSTALEWAEVIHRDDARKFSGAPYVHHPLRVGGLVASLPGVSGEMIQAAFLHDAIEDHPGIKSSLMTYFSPEVMRLVEELTNVSKASGKSRAERKVMDRERLAKVSLEAKRIKLCDRLDNVSESLRDCRRLDLPREDLEFLLLYADETRALVPVLSDANPGLAGMVIEAAREMGNAASGQLAAIERG